MESDNASPSTSVTIFSSSEHYKEHLHLSNIQLLASIDCALALITLVFNLKQAVVTIDGFPNELRLREGTGVDEEAGVRILAAAIASVCLTLTQLLLACLVMASLSKREQNRTFHTDTSIRTVPGIWVLWSILLLIVLVVYISRIKQFEDFGDKFYLFTLISEIILRIAIILYVIVFFWWNCCNNKH